MRSTMGRYASAVVITLGSWAAGCGSDDDSGSADTTAGDTDTTSDTADSASETADDTVAETTDDTTVDTADDTTDDTADDTAADTGDADDTGEPPIATGTLAAVQAAGNLRCGVNRQALGLGIEEDDGTWSGFDVDFCRAIAAAVLGDADEVTFIGLSAAERFEALTTDQIDVLIRNTTWTEARDAALGVDFGPTTLYDGQKLLGSSATFSAASTLADIDGLTVCVPGGTTSELNITDAAAEAGISITITGVEGFDALVQGMADGTCDLATTDASALAGIGARLTADGHGDFALFPGRPLSKEPLGPVYREDDSQWADVVNWTVYAMIIADEKGITSDNIDTSWDSDAESTALFGGESEGQTAMGLSADAFRRVIAQVGNFDEVFERNLAQLGWVRAGSPNARFDEGGLLFAPRAGGALPAELGPADKPETSLLESVQTRGTLNCGVSGGAVGFSESTGDGDEVTGFDADFCRAVAAAVLGDANAVEFFGTTAQERFIALADGTIDVLIRNTTWTQSRDVRFDFAPTTYYDGQKLMGRASSGYTTETVVSDLGGSTICVIVGTTNEENIENAIAAAEIEATIVPVEDFGESLEGLQNGDCDLVTSDESGLAGIRVALAAEGLDDLVIFPPQPISKEPLGPVYRANDSAWADVVSWVVFAMVIADEKGVTSDNIDEMWDVDLEAERLFGGESELQTELGLHAQAFRRVIEQVGNYDEVFRDNLDPLGLAREGTLNDRWTNGGLIYAPPAR